MPGVPAGKESVVAVLGLLAAACAAVLNSAAGLLEAAGGRRSAGGRVLRQPLYVAGLLVDVLGFLLTVFALRYLPVFAVQAVLAGAIAITALAANRIYRQPLTRADRLAIAACVAGLAVVAASAGEEPAPPPHSVGFALLAACGVLAVAAVPVWRAAKPVACAVLAGLAFGGVSLSVRALHLRSTLLGDLEALPLEASAWALTGFAALGLAAYTKALTLGDVSTVTGVLVVTEAVVPGLAGIALLGDTVRAGWALPCAAGLVLAVGGVVVLSRSAATRPVPRAAPGRPGPAPAAGD